MNRSICLFAVSLAIGAMQTAFAELPSNGPLSSVWLGMQCDTINGTALPQSAGLVLMYANGQGDVFPKDQLNGLGYGVRLDGKNVYVGAYPRSTNSPEFLLGTLAQDNLENLRCSADQSDMSVAIAIDADVAVASKVAPLPESCSCFQNERTGRIFCGRNIAYRTTFSNPSQQALSLTLPWTTPEVLPDGSAKEFPSLNQCRSAP